MAGRMGEHAPAGVHRYVALGDSASCGAGTDGATPWPALLATRLGREVRHTNLSRAGATAEEVERHQLAEGLALGPDLISLICGANDLLASGRPDVAAYTRCFARMLERIAAEAPTSHVFTATYPELPRFAALHERSAARLRRALEALNDATRTVAAEHDVLCLDWAAAALTRADFAADGLHPRPHLQRRMATDALGALQDWLAGQRRASAA